MLRELATLREQMTQSSVKIAKVDDVVESHRVFRNADWAPEMVALPAGRFLMGSPEGEPLSSEGPQHEVKIGYRFALGRYAVTNGEYRCFRPEHDSGEGFNDDRQPVVAVNWLDAHRYLEWLNNRLGLQGKRECYRLPSEAEWEYACRAGTTGRYSFDGPITADKANYDASEGGCTPVGLYREKTVPVGYFPANPWGLHEMHGNVLEWMEDNWHRDYENAPANGSAWKKDFSDSRRVLRGGSWDDYPRFLRSAIRNCNSPYIRHISMGFRIARTLSE